MMSQRISDLTCCATQSSCWNSIFLDHFNIDFTSICFILSLFPASNGRVTSVTRWAAEDAGEPILITRNLYK